MIVRDKFILDLNKPNLLNLKKSQVKNKQVANARDIIKNTILMTEGIRHMSKPYVFNMLKKKDSFCVLYLEDYPFIYSYNKPTDQLVINIFPFGIKTVTPQRPNVMDMYCCLASSLCLANLTNGNVMIKTHYMEPVISFFTSLFIQMFGRTYGITEKYSVEIPKLKFLIALYVYIAFDGLEKEAAKKLARTASAFNYDPYEDELDKFTLTDIRSLIESLSKLGAMPGMTIFSFYATVHKFFGRTDAMLMFEDFSRCISVILASNIEGSSIVPSFLKKYNNEEFFRIITIAKLALVG